MPRRPARFRLLNLLVRLFPSRSKYRNNAILLVRHINNASLKTEAGKYQFGWAEQNDINRIASHPEARSKDVYQTRLEKGDRCFCIKCNDEIIGYNWIAFQRCCHLCGSCYEFEFFPLNRNQAFTYDYYIYQKYRGQGMAISLKKQLIIALKSDGIDEIYTLVEPTNVPSMKIHLRLGYEPVCMVYSYRILNWRKSFTHLSGNQDSLNKWVDSFMKSHGI